MELQKYTYNKQTFYVDYRLEQFRSIEKFPDEIKFVDFDSEKGDKILSKMIRDSQANFGLLHL